MKLHLASAAALVALSTLSAQAATVTLNVTTNIMGAISDDSELNKFESLGAPVAISVGDTVDLTVNFLPGQRLTMSSSGGLSFFTGWLYHDGNPPNSSAFSIANIDYSLTGLMGTLAQPFSPDLQSSGVAHLGAGYFGSYIDAGESVSFTGYHVSYDVTALQEGTSSYTDAWVLFTADRVSVVPEPGTYALMALGLVGISGLAGRRRRV